MSILTLATRTASVIRPQALPVEGRLFRRGLEEPLGHPFVDEDGTDDVVVVEARDALPRGAEPGVHGLTVEVSRADGSTLQLVFSGGSWARMGLRMWGDAGREWTLSGVLPSADSESSDSDGLMLAARRVGGHTYELAVALPDGEWQEFACLLLSTRVAA
ncbi:hypothetical protein [Nocardioides sp. SYSU DS0663]|uniref:hypothetical protein n=1 Tax=Nocardioides sp. SYSU DS0663 TaxID=3416445 RepID=UPI003F4C77C0